MFHEVLPTILSEKMNLHEAKSLRIQTYLRKVDLNKITFWKINIEIGAKT